jgi:hypothetical protein
VEGERLLVRQRKDEVPVGAVRDVEELRNPDPVRLLPELGRGEHGRKPLLRADRVELLADDLLDLAVDAPAERQERPEAGRDLPDEAGADKQLVRDGLGVRGRIAQRRQEEL